MGTSNLFVWLTDPALQALLGGVFTLLAADFLTGIIAAIRTRTITQKQVGDILIDQGTQVAFVTVLAILAGSLSNPLGVMAVTAGAAYAITAQKSIRENLGELMAPVVGAPPVDAAG